MNVSIQAENLRQKLYALAAEFKDLSLDLNNVDASSFSSEEAASRARSQADAAARELAAVYAKMSGPSAEWDLFVDANKDCSDYVATPAFDFGARLQAIREQSNMTLEDLAALSGVSDQVLLSYEQGLTPAWDDVRAIANALGVSADTFRSR